MRYAGDRPYSGEADSWAYFKFGAICGVVIFLFVAAIYALSGG